MTALLQARELGPARPPSIQDGGAKTRSLPFQAQGRPKQITLHYNEFIHESIIPLQYCDDISFITLFGY